jgi:hypothetical protein
MGLIDPVGAVAGGVAGLAVDSRNGGPSLLGGMLGAGVVGTAVGVATMAQCNKAIQERHAPTLRSLGPVTLPGDLDSISYRTFSDRVREAMRAGRVPAQQAAELLRVTDQIAEAARRSN